MIYSVLSGAFHCVQGRTLRTGARKPFWPAPHGGQAIHVSDFQRALKTQCGKIMVGLRLATDPANGIASVTYLGENLLSKIRPNRDIANYLYVTATIHPRFFAEALHVIASNSKTLAPHTQKIQLRLLGRENLKKALDSGAVNALDIGKNFNRFGSLPLEQKLSVLEKLGVIQLKPGSQEAWQSQVIAKQSSLCESAQLRLFDRLELDRPD